jgi:hypothetical protein
MDFLLTIGAAGFPDGIQDSTVLQVLGTFISRRVVKDVDFDSELGLLLSEVIEESWAGYEDWLRDPNWGQ